MQPFLFETLFSSKSEYKKYESSWVNTPVIEQILPFPNHPSKVMP